MAAGGLGSVQSRSQHQNGDTHVGLGDDVFSDAGSTPAASTTFPQEFDVFGVGASHPFQSPPLLRGVGVVLETTGDFFKNALRIPLKQM